MNTTDSTSSTTGTATLDPPRIDQLRTFLVIEAAADLAQARTHQQARAGTALRRVAIGGVAAALLVGAVIALDVGTSPKANRAEAAISITGEDGWTTLHLNDPNASADQVLAELHAAGIKAKAAPEGDNPWEEEPGSAVEAVGISTDLADTEVSRANAAPGTIVGIVVQSFQPDGSSFEEAYGQDGPNTPAEQRAEEQAIGVQIDQEAHTVSIRNSDDHPVTLQLAT